MDTKRDFNCLITPSVCNDIFPLQRLSRNELKILTDWLSKKSIEDELGRIKKILHKLSLTI